MDIGDEINAIQRETGQGRIKEQDVRTITLRRSYDAPIEDVWDAITDPKRVNRWFLPVTGDFRLGGTYQIENNAGGEIVACEPPERLKVTWVLGEPSEADLSEVEVRLSPGTDGQTLFELCHTAVVDPGFWSMYGPGAVGVGWDLTLLGLGLHLGGGEIDKAEREAFEQSPEARDFMTRSSRAWGAAYEASGADSAEVATVVENTTKFYAPDQDAPSQS
ncbi:SRPBCC family protein [Actinopolymorpha sp. B17G11]|uniref:SRPBCC family protein n=1 Tax=unclassified Actinopolymorpha TaxID=2627063 RepID=UPI0032D8BB2D